MFRKLSLALAVSLALPPLGVFALGLGDIETRSALNESFNADIRLVSVQAGEIDDVKVDLAAPGDFALAGVDRPYFLSKLRFEPMMLDDGSAVIRVTSREPVREPYLDFLIEVNWPKGRLVREFTVLLDPPVVLEREPPPIAIPVVDSQQRVARRPVPLPGQAPQELEGGLEYGPVRSGATLWGIARELGVAGVTTEQVTLALFRNNPDAFIDGNINLLKVGAILRLPADDAVFLMAPAEARRAFLSQANGGSTGEGVAAPRPAVPSRPVDRLRIATAQPDEDVSAGAGERLPGKEMERVKTDLMMVRETSESTRQETEELRGRIHELESQLQDIRQLLKLKSDQLAQLQSGQEAETPVVPVLVEEEEVEVRTGPGPEPETEAVSESGPAPEMEPETETMAPADQQPAPVAGPAEAPKPPVAPQPAVTQKKPAAAPQAPPAPVQEPGLLDRFLGDTLLQAIAGVVVAVLLLLAWLLVRRRREEEDSFQESALLSPAQESVLGSELQPEEEGGKAQPSAEETSFISDFSPSDIDALQEETGEVDPAAEADVYIAYGRYQQAESLINQAIEKQPDRLDLKLKLLEIYFTTRNVATFTQLAEELDAAGAADKEPQLWQRVVSMGQELIPQHRLFGAGASEPETETETESEPEFESDLDLDTQETTAALSASAQGLADNEGEPLPELDLELDTEISELATEEAPGSGEPALDEGAVLEPPGLPELEPEESIPAPGTKTEAETEEPELAIDLEDLKSLEDIDFGEMEEEVEIPSPVPEEKGITAEEEMLASEMSDEPSEINLDELDLGEAEKEAGAQPLSEMLKEPDRTEEVETKLDLARAYLEMGDGDGAKEILQEVLEEGSDKQKTEAQDLIEQIG